MLTQISSVKFAQNHAINYIDVNRKQKNNFNSVKIFKIITKKKVYLNFD